MRTLTVPTLLAVLALGGACARADTYTVAIKRHPDAGRGLICLDIERRTCTVKESENGGKPRERRTAGAKEESYTETILENGDAGPRKYRRTYLRATLNADGKPYSRSYSGKVVLFERGRDGKTAVSLEGQGELHPFDKQELAALADERADELDDVILPKKPLEIGGRWAIDPKALATAYARSGGLDTARSRGEGVLRKVYAKDGHTFGVLEVTLNLAVVVWDGVRYDPPAAMEVRSTLDAAIDGRSTAATFTLYGRMTGRGIGDRDGRKTVVDIDAVQAVKQERSAEK